MYNRNKRNLQTRLDTFQHWKKKRQTSSEEERQEEVQEEDHPQRRTREHHRGWQCRGQGWRGGWRWRRRGERRGGWEGRGGGWGDGGRGISGMKRRKNNAEDKDDGVQSHVEKRCLI